MLGLPGNFITRRKAGEKGRNQVWRNLVVLNAYFNVDGEDAGKTGGRVCN